MFEVLYQVLDDALEVANLRKKFPTEAAAEHFIDCICDEDEVIFAAVQPVA